MTAEPRTGSFASLAVEEPYAGLRRRTFDTTGATVNEYRFEPGAAFPLHRHPEEQITLVTDGEIELTAAGEVTSLGIGDWSVIPGEVEHGIRAGAAGAGIVAIIVPRRASPSAYTLAEGAG
jgi:quercetin dioxygenase-like cupin family protein